ncbi:MAG: ATP-binding protein [Bacteroidota bacterium]
MRDTTYSAPGLNLPGISLHNKSKPKKKTTVKRLSEIHSKDILENLGFEAGIYVDEDFSILETFGNYEKYLLPKYFNFSLLEMLPEQLSMATSLCLRKAIENQSKRSMHKVAYLRNEEKQVIDLVVIPIETADDKEAVNCLVLYSDHKQKEKDALDSGETFDIDEHSLQHINDLKQKLAYTEEKLKKSYEELDESNDNISSYNEELISSNEELQSTNEELQSVNEELQTVNNEHQLKIKALAELNDDLNNFFKGTINGQIYIDSDMILRKFTPPATKQINLKNSDIGRPLSDISTKMKIPTLIDDIQTVIENFNGIDKEIQTLDNRWYHMAITPYYKEKENAHDGVIVTFNDVTELKRSQHRLSRINEDHSTFIHSVSHNLKGPLANIEAMLPYLKGEKKSSALDHKKIVNVIQNSFNNLSQIISELSDITKIESEVGECERVNLKALFKEVKTSLQEELNKSEATIICDFKEPTISFSRKNLRNILLNLLSNALKYRSPDRVPEITISTEKEKDYTVLSIQDNGLGMKSDKIEGIFNIFTRIHNHVEGTGVGLYLVKKITENAGGEIKVESELGKGSTFKVYFKN